MIFGPRSQANLRSGWPKDLLIRAAGLFMREPQAFVVMGHSVGPTGPNHIRIDSATLRAQLQFLKIDLGRQFLTMSEFVSRCGTQTLPERTVCLTFDDGYLDNYEHLWPILSDLKLPATIYCVRDFVESETTALGFPAMGKRHLRELVASGLVEIGSHTCSHPDLTAIPRAQLAHEVRQSKEYLEDLLGQEVAHFAYPKGRHDAATVAAVADAGYRSATTVEVGYVDGFSDRFRLPRLVLDPRLPVATLDPIGRGAMRTFAAIRNFQASFIQGRAQSSR